MDCRTPLLSQAEPWNGEAAASKPSLFPNLQNKEAERRRGKSSVLSCTQMPRGTLQLLQGCLYSQHFQESNNKTTRSRLAPRKQKYLMAESTLITIETLSAFKNRWMSLSLVWCWQTLLQPKKSILNVVAKKMSSTPIDSDKLTMCPRRKNKAPPCFLEQLRVQVIFMNLLSQRSDLFYFFRDLKYI